MNEIPYEVVKVKYQEFVQNFLSGEEETERTEMLPNLWSVINRKHDFKASIECEYIVKDLRTMEKDWFAVVVHEGEKSRFLLQF